MADRQPWYKKYPTDWRGDTNLRACSLAARGLWDECLGLMHEAEPRGYLVFADEPVSVDKLALLVSRPLKEVRAALAELEHAGVPSRDEHGTIYSRRMVRDTAKSAQASVYGSRGGNPRLKGGVNGQVKPLDNPAGAQTRDLGSEDLPSGSGSEEEPEREPNGFETFWAAYPRHTNRKAAERAFAKLAPNAERLAVLLAAIERQKGGRQWRDGVYAHAATWLNGARWEDELEPAAATQRGPTVPRPEPPRGSWRDRCHHSPMCQTPTACELLTEKAEVPA